MISERAIRLDAADAASVGYALVTTAAAVTGARALVIKGSSASFHRLRAERVSADIDVLVEPACVELMTQYLEGAGWKARPTSQLAETLVDHSVSFLHPDWPIDIDVHHRYPGLLVEATTAFEALWSRRTTMHVAGYEVPIPDRAGAILIGVLHNLRTTAETSRHVTEYANVVERVIPTLSEADRRDSVELARQVGALDSARVFLLELGIPLPPATPSAGARVW